MGPLAVRVLRASEQEMRDSIDGKANVSELVGGRGGRGEGLPIERHVRGRTRDRG